MSSMKISKSIKLPWFSTL